MPLNVKGFCTTCFTILIFALFAFAQQSPTSGDVMRERITKAKSFIAVRNFNAAIYELENIRRESGDATVQSVCNVLLISSYLEQGDYKRAQTFLTEFYNGAKAGKPNAASNYLTIAGQVVRFSRSQFDRYRSLGLSVSDRNLPLEAVNDIENIRQTLEMLVETGRTLSGDRAKNAEAMALIEEAARSRSSYARDDFDAKRWKDQLADTREDLASAQRVVADAVPTIPEPTGSTELVAANNPKPKTELIPAPPVTVISKKDNDVRKPSSNPNPTPTVAPVSGNVPKLDKKKESEVVAKVVDLPKPPVETPKTAADEEAEKVRNRVVENDTASKTETSEPTTDNGPLDVGSLVEYATQRSQPSYPTAARSVRQSGVVRVEVVIDEDGKVAEINSTSGPSLLQGAAKDAIKKWKFRPFTRDGQPVKATGFVSFNFAL